jgi:hypothetical protein
MSAEAPPPAQGQAHESRRLILTVLPGTLLLVIVFGLVRCWRSNVTREGIAWSTRGKPDGKQDARSAIQRGDLQLLALPAGKPRKKEAPASLCVPGAPDFSPDKPAPFKYRPLDGICAFDFVGEPDEQYRRAYQYALDYNQTILEELKKAKDPKD